MMVAKEDGRVDNGPAVSEPVLMALLELDHTPHSSVLNGGMGFQETCVQSYRGLTTDTGRYV